MAYLRLFKDNHVAYVGVDVVLGLRGQGFAWHLQARSGHSSKLDLKVRSRLPLRFVAPALMARVARFLPIRYVGSLRPSAPGREGYVGPSARAVGHPAIIF